MILRNIKKYLFGFNFKKTLLFYDYIYIKQQKVNKMPSPIRSDFNPLAPYTSVRGKGGVSDSAAAKVKETAENYIDALSTSIQETDSSKPRRNQFYERYVCYSESKSDRIEGIRKKVSEFFLNLINSLSNLWLSVKGVIRKEPELF
ncbi:MAG: hypothetical protein WAM28_08655 [Chlamydiales bacterium]